MNNEVQKLVEKISNRENLSREESARMFQIIMNGGATPAQISAALLGLKTKIETVEEISGAVDALRHKMVKLNIPDDLRKKAIDVCGTGGDSKGTYNISTAVSFVAAGCGIPVAKHGNRAISSNSGSADVLKALGVNIEISPEQAAQTLQQAGIVFLFAPTYHKSFVHVAPIRVELGTRTIFNILGPLLNPAQVERQVIGVYARELVVPVCNVLKNIGVTSAIVAHGADGMDEITLCDKTYIAELSNNKIHEYEISPEVLGLKKTTIDKLVGGDAKRNAQELHALLKGAQTEYRDAVLLNSAAALKVAGTATDLAEGIEIAAESIDSGRALASLNKLVEISNMFN